MMKRKVFDAVLDPGPSPGHQGIRDGNHDEIGGPRGDEQGVRGSGQCQEECAEGKRQQQPGEVQVNEWPLRPHRAQRLVGHPSHPTQSRMTEAAIPRKGPARRQPEYAGGAAAGLTPAATGRGSMRECRAVEWLELVVSLFVILGGAELFTNGIEWVGDGFGLSQGAVGSVLAAVATELPEKFNSVIWVRRGKDTLALGNMTGAMVFQSSFPVTVGLLLTPWHLAHEALVAAVIALVAGGVLWLTIRLRGRFSAPLLLLQGAFFAGYVVYVVRR